MTNQSYQDCDNHIQMSRVQSTNVGGDAETPYNDWGDDYGNVYRDASDGERTMGYSGLVSNFEFHLRVVQRRNYDPSVLS